MGGGGDSEDPGKLSHPLASLGVNQGVKNPSTQEQNFVPGRLSDQNQ